MDTTKLKDAIEKLSEVDESYSDIFEELAVLVSDIEDCIEAKSSFNFLEFCNTSNINIYVVTMFKILFHSLRLWIFF